MDPHVRRLVSRSCLWLTSLVLSLAPASVPLCAQTTRESETREVDEGAAAIREAETYRLIRSLMSPYCPGLLLSDCRSEGARLLRVEIGQRIDAGEPADAIEADLVVRFGASIRTIPRFSGAGVVVWVAPAALGIAGLGIVVGAVRVLSRRRDDDAAGGAADAAPDDVERRVREELDRLD